MLSIDPDEWYFCITKEAWAWCGAAADRQLVVAWLSDGLLGTSELKLAARVDQQFSGAMVTHSLCSLS